MSKWNTCHKKALRSRHFSTTFILRDLFWIRSNLKTRFRWFSFFFGGFGGRGVFVTYLSSTGTYKTLLCLQRPSNFLGSYKTLYHIKGTPPPHIYTHIAWCNVLSLPLCKSKHYQKNIRRGIVLYNFQRGKNKDQVNTGRGIAHSKNRVRKYYPANVFRKAG